MADEPVPGTTPPEDETADWSTWAFSVITFFALVLFLAVSFIRYRQRIQVKRTKEEEYMDRFNMILPGYNYKEMKKTTARKIMTNTHMSMSMTDLHYRETLVSPEPLSASQDFGSTKPPTFSTNIIIDHRFAHGSHKEQYGDGNSTDSTGKDNVRVSSDNRDRHHKLEPYHSFRNTSKENVLTQQGENSNIIQDDTKAVDMKNNFSPMSLDVDSARRKNFIMYSPNEAYTLNRSEPVMYTFPSPEEMHSSVSNVTSNDFYMEAGLAPPKNRSKHRKSKKGAKKHKKLLESIRPRSLPQLDDVYFGNVTESNEYTSDLRNQEAKPFKISSVENVSKVFVKRNPLMADRALRQSDTNIPLLKMNSLPEVYPFGSSGQLNSGSALTSDHM